MRILVASGNEHKVREIASYLREIDCTVQGISDVLDSYDAPDEDGDTLLENALIKARALHALFPDMWVLADDSGLFVDALGGDPGVHSARYAGEPCDDAKNNEKLLENLTTDDRGAEFRCVLALVGDGEEHSFCGAIRGQIVYAPQGDGGFGYDPYFLPDGEKETFASMDATRKNQISHRANALRQLVQYLKEK